MYENTLDPRRFILWDPNSGYDPPRSSQGEIITSGVIGVMSLENVYLITYPVYPDRRRPADLPVGGCIRGIVYRLSGEKGSYDLWRIA